MKILGKAKQGASNNGYLVGERDGNWADGECRCQGNFAYTPFYFFEILKNFLKLETSFKEK